MAHVCPVNKIKFDFWLEVLGQIKNHQAVSNVEFWENMRIGLNCEKFSGCSGFLAYW
jgi:hypothetical protein